MRDEILGHLPMIYRIAWSLTGNEADAQDLAHDAMVAALSSIGRFRGDAKLSTWLTTILVNRHRSWRRSRAVRERPIPPPETASSEPCARIEHRETTEALRRALLRLDEEERLIVVLTTYQELDSKELGRMLGQPPGTIRSKLHDAREKLRGLMLEKHHG